VSMPPRGPHQPWSWKGDHAVKGKAALRCRLTE
jgi:hypothetical protein